MDNTLYYGDNLHVLRRHIADKSIDLIYLDPPFNSERAYSVLFKDEDHAESAAQVKAFEDFWEWDDVTDAHYEEVSTPGAHVSEHLATLLSALRSVLRNTNLMAYLVMMTVRLVELRRVLKPTGSLYLHCDPTASHYLKLILDAIFGPENFRNEIIWQRSGAKNDPVRYGRSHDTILFYTAGPKFTWNTQYQPFRDESVAKNYTAIEEGTERRYRLSDLTANKPGGDTDYEWKGKRPYKGRHWAFSKAKMEELEAQGRIVYRRTGMPVYKRYLDEMPGVPLQDVWTDIRLTSSAKERIGYPTQKPVALLERILATSSNPNDVVLDPFCGCGTSIEAAQRLGRTWIGIDITHLAITIIRKRLKAMPGTTFEVSGEPADVAGAAKLARDDPYQFQWWALGAIDARPAGRGTGREGKKGADRGIDGVIWFKDDPKKPSERIIVSVKGGQNLGPAMIRDLLGTVEREGAAIGVFLTLHEPTAQMRKEAREAGKWKSSAWGRSYPRIQILTIEDVLNGAKVEYAGHNVTLHIAPRPPREAKQLTLPEPQGEAELVEAPAAAEPEAVRP